VARGTGPKPGTPFAAEGNNHRLSNYKTIYMIARWNTQWATNIEGLGMMFDLQRKRKSRTEDY